MIIPPKLQHSITPFKTMLKNFFQNHKPLLLRGALFFLAFTVIGLFNFARFVTNELAEGNDANYRFYFIMEMTGVYTHLMVVPLIFLIVRKFPITRRNLFSRIPLHIFASMLIGATHSTLMFLSRQFIFWLGNLGIYEYGNFAYRLVMEYTHQFLTYWLWYAGIQFFGLMRRHQEQKIQTVTLQEQLTKARLQALQMQIRPHFLFNTLNMISSALYEDIHAADKMIANLSDLLRQTLDGVQQKTHALKKELALTKLYVNIMQARFFDKLNINWHIDPTLQQAQVPGFILQPLLENAIAYGMEKLSLLEIEIIAAKDKNKLVLTIADNGPGMRTNTKKSGQGVGLTNVAERLEKLYGANHKFFFRNREPGGFEVVIEIPYKINADGSQIIKHL